MRTECDRIQDALLAHVDGEEPSTEVRIHLRSCSACRKKAHAFRTLSHLLRGLPRKAYDRDEILAKAWLPLLLNTPRMMPPPGLDTEILHAVNDQHGEYTSGQRRADFGDDLRKASVPGIPRRLGALIQPLAAAVIIVYLAISGFEALQPRSTPSGEMSIEIQVDNRLYSHGLIDEGRTSRFVMDTSSTSGESKEGKGH